MNDHLVDDMNISFLPFVQAKWFTPATGRDIRLIVIHTTESLGNVYAQQSYTARRADKVSTHWFVGDEGIGGSVRPKDVAYAAPGANHDGLQIEVVGKAIWTYDQWMLQHSQTIENVAQLVAYCATAFDIPLIVLDKDAVLRGERGVVTHSTITAAFPTRGRGHWDPGAGFPMDTIVRRAATLLDPPAAAQVLPPPVNAPVDVSLEDSVFVRGDSPSGWEGLPYEGNGWAIVDLKDGAKRPLTATEWAVLRAAGVPDAKVVPQSLLDSLPWKA